MSSLTEQQQQQLEDLVFKGYIITKKKIINDLITLELKSMTGGTQLATEKSISGNEGASIYVLHAFAISSLASSLLSFETKEGRQVFESSAKAEEFIKTRPTAVIDAMISAHAQFEKEIKELLTPEKLTENFTTTPGTEIASSSI
jgi:hypothetical protein